MSNTVRFIEIENNQNLYRSTNDVDDRVSSVSSDLSGNEKAHRLHAIKEQLTHAETKCNVLKDELNFFRMFYNDSQENIKIENNNDLTTYTVKFDRDCNHFKKYITVSRMGNRNLNANTETSLIPRKEMDVRENDEQSDDRHLVLSYENAIKDLKAKLKQMRSNRADSENVKRKKSKILHTVSDVCIVPNKSCTETRKNAKGRLKSDARMADSRDTIRTSKKKMLKKDKKLLDLRFTNGKFTHCETMSTRPSSRFRRRKPKTKQNTSHLTVGGRISRSVDRSYRNPFHSWNSDLVELYHNNAAKSVTSQSDIFCTQRRRKRNEQHENNPNIHRVYEKYTLPDSYEAQYAKHIPQPEQNGFKQSISKTNQQSKPLANNQQATMQQNLQKQLKQQKNQQYRQQQQQKSVNIDVPDCDKVAGNDIVNKQFCKTTEGGQFFKKTESVMNQKFGKKPENIINEETVKKSDMVNQPPPASEFHCIQPPVNSRCYTATTMRTNSNFFAGYNIYHHYQLPTVSSRLKQVSKNYLQDFNIKTIPFVTTTSTTPSHNLGLNIQQVLSIMKTQHPVGGISPTLAHNMGLVTQSVGSQINGSNDTVSNILSRIGSRPNCIPSNRKKPCPLLRHATAVAESELANVQEHPNEDNASILSSLTVTMDVSKIGTEFDLKNRAMTEWDQPSPRACTQPKCTCVPRKQTPNSNKIFNRYMDGGNNTPRPGSYNPMLNNPRTKQKSAFSTVNKLNENPQLIKNNNAHTELTGKIRGIRDVLANLHNDFQKLNEQYDLLKVQVQKNKVEVDPMTVYKLETMEKELNTKEEEISVVIPLYQEVRELQEQLRNLKERTSMLSMSVCSSNKQRGISGFEPTVTLRLTKLLRQIQQFQGLLKIGP